MQIRTLYVKRELSLLKEKNLSRQRTSRVTSPPPVYFSLIFLWIFSDLLCVTRDAQFTIVECSDNFNIAKDRIGDVIEIRCSPLLLICVYCKARIDYLTRVINIKYDITRIYIYPGICVKWFLSCECHARAFISRNWISLWSYRVIFGRIYIHTCVCN